MNSPICKVFGTCILILIFPVNPLASQMETRRGQVSDGQGKFSLTVDKNLISLKAENSSLKAILETIGKKMKVEILGEIQEGETISAEFKQVPLAEALQRLSPNYGYQMGTEKGGQKISKIFVLSKPKGFVRPKSAAKDPQLVESVVSSELEVGELQDEPESGKKDDKPDEEKSARPEPFKFEFDPSALMPKSQ